MNTTKQTYTGRKLHQEDCPQKAAAEQREYAGVPVSVRIAEHNDIITDLPADSLLKRILSRDNLNGAYKKVKSNRGAGGVDKMSVDELLPYLREHRVDLLQQIRDGHYKPNPVRRVEIPKKRKGEVPEIRNPHGSRPGHPTGNRPDTDPNLRTTIFRQQLRIPSQTGSP